MASVRAIVAVLLLASVAVGVKSTSENISAERWKILDKYPADRPISYGTFYDEIFHRDIFWVQSAAQIDQYDITASRNIGPDGEPELLQSFSAGTTCLDSLTFIPGLEYITIHGDEQFCTCAWSEENPCPKRLEITAADGTRIVPEGNEEDGLIQFGGNTVFNIDLVIPDVTAEIGIAYSNDNETDPARTYACEPIVNPADIAGKYCLVDRGGCFFQTKVDNCEAAGGVGTLVVNRNEELFDMFITSTSKPTIIMRQSDGQYLKDCSASGCTATLGRTLGASAPLPEYTGEDALSIVNAWTGERVTWQSPFLTTESAIYDRESGIMYAIGIDGNADPSEVMVVNMTTNPPTSLGLFQQELPSSDIIYHPTGTILTAENFFTGTITFRNVDNPTSPVELSSITYEPICPDEQAGAFRVHPNQVIAYWDVAILLPECIEAGYYDVSTVRIYDIADLTDIKEVGTWEVPEAQVGADIRSLTWGPNNIGALALGSGGVVWYDFTDPLKPVKIAAYDPNEFENDYTVGSFGVRYDRNNEWIIRDNNAVYDEFHAVKIGESC